MHLHGQNFLLSLVEQRQNWRCNQNFRVVKIFVKQLFHGYNFLFFVKFSMTKQYLKRTSDYVIQYIKMS